MTFVSAMGGVLAGAIVAGAVGWGLARFFMPGLRRTEKLAWSFATGLLVQAILFVVAVSLFPRHGVLPILLADAAIVGASFLVRRSFENGDRPLFSALVVRLLVIAGVAWLVFLVAALSEPMWATDYLAMWGLKGKTIFETGFIPRRLFQDPALFWAHREYPLLVPFSLAMLASFAGSWHDQALALFFPLCELVTLCALFGFLTRRDSSLAGATAAALTALCFPLYRTANAGTAEIPFAFSVVLVSTAFLDALSERSRSALVRLAVASLFCVSIKQEGWIFVSLLAVALGMRRRWTPGLALVVPAALHWSLLYLLRGPQTRRDFDFAFFQPRHWAELAPRFFQVLGRFGAEALAAGLPLVVIVLYLTVTRRGFADPLLPVLVIQILCYAVAFSVSSFDPMYAVDGAFRRIATTLFPALTIVLCARLRSPAPA